MAAAPPKKAPSSTSRALTPLSGTALDLVVESLRLTSDIDVVINTSELTKDGSSEEFIATQRKLAIILELMKMNGITVDILEHDLKRMRDFLLEFRSIVEKMSSSGRLMKMLGNNRLRKKVDEINVQIIFLAKHFAKQIGTTFDSASHQRDLLAATVAAEVGFNDAEGLRFWNEAFGERTTLAEWNRFALELSKFQNKSISLSREMILKKIIDPSNIGVVSPFRFSQFLKGFGSIPGCLDAMEKLWGEPWFHGFISRTEAQKLLADEAVGTYLVRFSKSQCGCFALAFVSPEKKVIHVIVEGNLPQNFKVNETSGLRKFDTLEAVLMCYAEYLVTPLQITLTKEPWFHGDISEDDAELLMIGRMPGTYMVRLREGRGAFAISYLKEDLSIVHVNIDRIEVRGADFKISNAYRPAAASGFPEFTEWKEWLRDQRSVLRYHYDRTGTPEFNVKLKNLSTDLVREMQGPADINKAEEMDDDSKLEDFYAVCTTGYPEQRGGWWPICDSYLIRAFKEWTVVALADGCNWGPRPATAAVLARNAFVDFVIKHKNEFRTTSEVAYLLMKGFSVAHNKIIEGKEPDEVFECGTTTLLGGVLLPLDEGRHKEDPRWGFVMASVGDCKAYVYSHKKKSVMEITMGNRGGLDATDPGGRLGPFVDEGDPDLRNFRSYFCFVEEGDTIVVLSDGVHDNLDPVSLGKTPQEIGIQAANWDGLNIKEVEGKQVKWSLQFAQSLLNHCESPQDIVTTLLEHSFKITQTSRDYLRDNPNSRLPSDYKLYPGKMDHATAVAFRVGAKLRK